MAPQKAETHHGVWSLTTDPSQQAPGTLEIDESGKMTLMLAGALGASADKGSIENVLGMLEGQHRMFGTVDGGVGITLEGCFVRRAQGLGPANRQIWHVHEAVFGAKFDANEPWQFCGATLALPGLTTWVQRAHTGVNVEWDETGHAKRLGLFADIECLPLWSLDDAKVELARVVNTAQPREGLTEFESRVDAKARFESPSAPEVFHLTVTRPLQILIGLATGKFTTPVSSKVLVSPHNPGGRNDFLRWHWQPLEIRLDAARLDYAFHYSDFVALGDATAAWIKRRRELEPVWDLYLAVLREHGLAEMRFLFVTQALESYHRRTSDVKLVSEDSWTAIMAALCNVVADQIADEKLKDALKGRFRFMNELSLRQRLNSLLDAIGSASDEVSGTSRKVFVNSVVEARNFFTHWNSSDGKRPISNLELVHLTFRLLALLELLLARDIGFAFGTPVWTEILRRRIRWLPVGER